MPICTVAGTLWHYCSTNNSGDSARWKCIFPRISLLLIRASYTSVLFWLLEVISLFVQESKCPQFPAASGVSRHCSMLHESEALWELYSGRMRMLWWWKPPWVSGCNTACPKGHYHNCDSSWWWGLLCAGRSGSSPSCLQPIMSPALGYSVHFLLYSHVNDRQYPLLFDTCACITVNALSVCINVSELHKIIKNNRLQKLEKKKYCTGIFKFNESALCHNHN